MEPNRISSIKCEMEFDLATGEFTDRIYAISGLMHGIGYEGVKREWKNKHPQLQEDLASFGIGLKNDRDSEKIIYFADSHYAFNLPLIYNRLKLNKIIKPEHYKLLVDYTQQIYDEIKS